MRSKVAKRILDNTTEDVKIFVRLYADIIVRVNQLLKEKGYTQKLLAEKLDKTPSEIHKWLSNEHNFTLKSLAKLQAELGSPILYVPIIKTVPSFTCHYGKATLKVYRNVEKIHINKNEEGWNGQHSLNKIKEADAA
jgi:transcriptional regulator with XRE-family HTH domain